MIYRRTSYSQVSTHCGKALGYKRANTPTGPPNISMLQGSAVHAGLEDCLEHGEDVNRAIEVAPERLDFDIEAAGGESAVRWEDAPRLTKGYRWKDNGEWGRWKTLPNPYSGEAGLLHNRATAETLTRLMVKAWVERFGGMTVTPLAVCPRCGAPSGGKNYCTNCSYVLVGIERKERMPLPFGWELTVVYDIEPDEGGIVDAKVTREAWDTFVDDIGLLRLNPNGRQWDRAEQALIYQLAQERLHGQPPDSFYFHNLPRSSATVEVTMPDRPGWHACAVDHPQCSEIEGGPCGGRVEIVGYDPQAIQLIHVPYDRAAAEAVIHHRVMPTIEMIEAGAYKAQFGWWCSERFCDFWAVCEFGRALRGRTSDVLVLAPEGAA